MSALRIYLDADGLLDLISADPPTDNENGRLIGLALTVGTLIFVTSEVAILEAPFHALGNKTEAPETILRKFLIPSINI